MDLGLSEYVLKPLDKLGYEVPTPIQAATIPHLLAGRDLLGQAQTGTGKTAAFALPLLTRLDINRKTPQVLVLTPTRELAIQVAEAFQRYASGLREFHVAPIYGGQDMGMQLKKLKRGVHVVVGTPGRVMDHMRRGTLKLGQLSTLVLDEADEMLRMGFLEDIEWILEQVPAESQVALFSATLPAPIRRIAHRHLENPAEITIEHAKRTSAAIRQRYWMVDGMHKMSALARILEVEEYDAILVFVRTKTMTVELATRLESQGFAAAALSGDMSQAQREETVGKFKAGALDILVATDVAARGLDIDRISHVINFDIPNNVESYIHRIGRTGRAGRSGETILFVAPREKGYLHALKKAMGGRMEPMALPTARMVHDVRVARFRKAIAKALADESLGLYRELLDAFIQESSVDALDVAAAIALLLHADKPLTPPREPAPPAKRVAAAPHQKASTRPAKPHAQAEAPADEGEGDKSKIGWECFRIDVGRRDGVQAGDLVAVLSQEAGLDRRYIGRIDIKDGATFIELPQGMPRQLYRELKKLQFSGKPTHFTRVSPRSHHRPDKQR